jgi:hypothetical protein
MLYQIPTERLLVETDAPYLTPAPEKNRTRRNEPAFVKSVLLTPIIWPRSSGTILTIYTELINRRPAQTAQTMFLPWTTCPRQISMPCGQKT